MLNQPLEQVAKLSISCAKSPQHHVCKFSSMIEAFLSCFCYQAILLALHSDLIFRILEGINARNKAFHEEPTYCRPSRLDYMSMRPSLASASPVFRADTHAAQQTPLYSYQYGSFSWLTIEIRHLKHGKRQRKRKKARMSPSKPLPRQ